MKLPHEKDDVQLIILSIVLGILLIIILMYYTSSSDIRLPIHESIKYSHRISDINTSMYWINSTVR